MMVPLSCFVSRQVVRQCTNALRFLHRRLMSPRERRLRGNAFCHRTSVDYTVRMIRGVRRVGRERCQNFPERFDVLVARKLARANVQVATDDAETAVETAKEMGETDDDDYDDDYEDEYGDEYDETLPSSRAAVQQPASLTIQAIARLLERKGIARIPVTVPQYKPVALAHIWAVCKMFFGTEFIE